jgi:hypothetical protein
VLFSSDSVATFINNQFEPVWVSVRDVPLVTIDFGNGSKIVRTLNGNVATYALTADGTILDILPGIYQPEVYVEQLNQFVLLNRYAHSFVLGKTSEILLKEYHAKQAELLGDGKEPGKIVYNFAAAVSKARVENPLKFVIGDAANGAKGKAVAASPQAVPVPPESPVSKTLRGWKELTEDTVLNETVHRKAIHEQLAAMNKATPNDITKWLYKNILHADLDDPTLGLGEILSKNYPFAEEDRTAAVRP